MSRRLGVGRHTAAIAERGGRRRVADISDKLGAVDWDRILSDVSDASVTLASSARSKMAGVFPWSHELHLWRDGAPVWCGPIQRITNGDGYTVEASDLAAWLRRRRTPFQTGPMYQKQFTATDLVDIAQPLLVAGYDLTTSRFFAFGEDAESLDVLRHVQASPSGIFTDYYVDPVGQNARMIIDHLAALVELGMRWTVLGRRIILGGDIARRIPTLTDVHFAELLKETVDGAEMGNGLHGEGGPTGGVDAIGSNQSYFGVLESVADTTNVQSDISAWSNRWMALHSHFPPSTINIEDGVALSPDAPLDINALVPGAYADVALSSIATPIRSTFTLARVSVHEEGGAETVTPVFLPEAI